MQISRRAGRLGLAVQTRKRRPSVPPERIGRVAGFSDVLRRSVGLRFAAAFLAAAAWLAAAPPAAAIEGGSFVDRGADPAAASIGYLVFFGRVPPDVWKPTGACTATLVSPTVALTSAHCVLVSDEFHLFFADDLQTPAPNLPRARVVGIAVSPKIAELGNPRCSGCAYDEDLRRQEKVSAAFSDWRLAAEDYALIRLDRQPPGSEPIGIGGASGLMAGVPSFAFGYGVQGGGGGAGLGGGRLKACQLEAVGMTDDDRRASSGLIVTIGSRWSCAVGHGDSGGPLLENASGDASGWRLVGVTSGVAMLRTPNVTAAGPIHMAVDLHRDRRTLEAMFDSLGTGESNPFAAGR